MRKMTGDEFDPLVTFFDQMAKTSWLSSVHDQLKELTGSWAGKTVLDVGCGTGRLLARGVSDAHKLIGIDLSKEMIEASKKLLISNKAQNSELLVGDAYHLPLANEKIDIALSTCVMFLLPEPEKGIAEISRVVKKGGIIAMLNPSTEMSEATATNYAVKEKLEGFERESLLKWSTVSTRRHRYTSDQLDSLLFKKGLRNVSHVPVLAGLATITVAVKEWKGASQLGVFTFMRCFFCNHKHVLLTSQ
ncbi:class I SAM-dependent methyltransferase [bacterium LRH843]|nr:class I SAM-dependent methyltransferase [bacterium LRH843]